MQWLAQPIGWLVRGIAFVVAISGLLIGLNATQHAPQVGWVSLVFAFAGWFPVILVHELGHALAAWSVGWRVWVFHVAPFALYTRPPSWRFTGYMSGPDIAGFVLALPRDARADTWRRSLWVSLGGPLASWLLAAACLSVLWWSPLLPRSYAADDLRRYVDDTTWTGGLIFAFGCYSLAAALLSSWPRATSHRNDAKHIAETLAHKTTLGLPHSGASLAAYLSKQGIPVAAMEPWMIGALERSGGLPSAAASDLLTRILNALIDNDSAAARAACVELTRDHPLSTEARVAQAFAAIWFNTDVAAADAILSKLHVPVQDDCFRLRQLTLAAIHKLENEIEAAERVLDELMTTAGGSYRFSLAAWETLCRQVMQRAPIAPLS